MNPGPVLEILKNEGVLTDEHAEVVLSQAADSSKDLAQLIVETGGLDRNTIFTYISKALGLEYYDLKGHTPPAEIISAIPAATARLYKAVPVSYDGHVLTVALADPLDHQAGEELGFALSQEMKFCVGDSKYVLDAIQRIYVAGEGTGQMNDILGQLKSIALTDGDDESEANSAPIVRYIDLVLEQAMRE